MITFYVQITPTIKNYIIIRTIRLSIERWKFLQENYVEAQRKAASVSSFGSFSSRFAIV